jgi:drug/metabolite transporter (DMT)-like permease
MMCIYYCIKFFPVVFVVLVQNISPLLLAVLSYWLYKVALSRLEAAVLAVSFIGVLILLSGSTIP